MANKIESVLVWSYEDAEVDARLPPDKDAIMLDLYNHSGCVGLFLAQAHNADGIPAGGKLFGCQISVFWEKQNTLPKTSETPLC
jgi:hypothetical protein